MEIVYVDWFLLEIVNSTRRRVCILEEIRNREKGNMNGYYECEDPLALTRVKQQNLAYPYRSRSILQQECPANPPASAVWNVVSSLVQALSDARDELLTLLTSDGVQVARKSDAATKARQSGRSPTSRSPSRSPCRSPCRSLSRPLSAPSDLRRSRSPLRASGDCGMIRSSNSSGNQKSRTMTAACYTPPVSFGMNLQFDSVRRGRSPPAGCRRPAGRYQPMTLNQRGMITPHGLEYVQAVVPGERRRHCAATRFAELLQAETYQLRERRVAEESAASALRSRPSWY